MIKIPCLALACAAILLADESVIRIPSRLLPPLEDGPKLRSVKDLLFTQYNSILPQIASAGTEAAGGFYTILTVTALTDRPSQVAVLFFDDAGASLTMPVVQPNLDGSPCFRCPPQFVPGVGGQLLPGQSLGQAILPSGGLARSGYAAFLSDPPVSVAVTGTFAQIVPGRPLFLTGIPPSYDLHQKAFMYTIDAGGFTSSIALVAARGATNIDLIFRSNLLNVQCTTRFFMPAASHRAAVLHELLPCMAGQEGSVEIQGVGFAGVGIWAHDQGAFVTQPLVERLAP
jgi:hypothetical protein